MDEKYMRIAIEQARDALALDEVPVGAVLVMDGNVIARAHNLVEASNDPTAHAEILVLREAARKLKSWRLNGSTLYVTLEPCAMCAGAALNARVSRIVYGAFETITGCCGSVVDITDHWFNHSIEVIGGYMEDECAVILDEYFSAKREMNKAE